MAASSRPGRASSDRLRGLAGGPSWRPSPDLWDGSTGHSDPGRPSPSFDDGFPSRPDLTTGWVPDFSGAPETPAGSRRQRRRRPGPEAGAASRDLPVAGPGSGRQRWPGRSSGDERGRWLPAEDESGWPAEEWSSARDTFGAPVDATDLDDDDWTEAEDWSPPTDPGAPSRFRAVRHRVDRWSERWVPEPIRQSRSRLSGRAAALLTVIGVVAVLVAGWTWWSGRPAQTPAGSGPLLVSTGDTVTSSAAESGLIEAPGASTTPVPTPVSAGQIWVSVTGRVHAPGLFAVPAGSRVADALEAAGGLLDPADLTGINLAQPLTDGQSVVVTEGGAEVESVASVSGPGPAGSSSGKVDLNAADQATLETLPGVGPVMAQAILTWRTDHGPFTAVEQLQEVTGIGPARYAQLAPLVSV